MQHNLILKVPLWKISEIYPEEMQVDPHAPLWGDVFQPMTEIPDLIKQYEVNFSNPWLKFPTWSSNFSSQRMSKNGDFNVIGGIATKISSFKNIFVKLGEIKFKYFF